jgi:hypothetical protein
MRQGAQQEPKKQEEKPKAPEVDKKALFGSIQSISFPPGKTIPNAPFNFMLTRQAAEAFNRAGLSVAENAPAVMELTVEAVKPGNPHQLWPLVMSAEVKCKGPDDEMIKVWEHQMLLREVPQHMLQQRGLLQLVRSEVGDFFDKFVADYREAAAEIEAGERPKP